MSISTSIATAIQQEVQAFAQIVPLLPEAVVQEVTARVQQLQQPVAVAPQASVNSAVVPLLVTRPGIPPRPLDPFYFEVTPLPAKL